jgi:hypothetical protein
MAHVHGAAKAHTMGALSAMARPAAGHELPGRAVAGVATTAALHAGRSVVGRFFKSPWVLFGIGLTAGYFAHKYRKEIVAVASRAGEKGKDFVLQQRENLEDLLGAARESED